MEFLDLKPLAGARGSIDLPGSKSISNRTLLLAALAHGSTVIRDLLKSDDTDRMLDALGLLGVAVEQIASNDYRITGTGGQFKVKSADLFLGKPKNATRKTTN